MGWLRCRGRGVGAFRYQLVGAEEATCLPQEVLAHRPGDPFAALQNLDHGRPGVPEGGREVHDRLAALFPVTTFPLLDRAFDIAFDVREYRPGDVAELAGCRVSLHLLRHAAPNCGIRIESANATLAYTGLTEGEACFPGWTPDQFASLAADLPAGLEPVGPPTGSRP